MQTKNNEKSAGNSGNSNVTNSDDKKSSIGQSGLPSISIPKGGGAIRGIGEKFATNPVTGTASLSVPIFTSPGRSGFGPSLSLSYDSGSGNGPFGFGWSLSLPSITRKTSKGIPKYQDAGDESDVFILSGAEDLVPAFKKDENGEFEKDEKGNFVIDEHDRDGFAVRRYMPRTEGLFARIERWTNKTTGNVHWRSISKDNVLTVYGRNSASRITDPSDESGTRIFSWLICQSYDDKGNAIVYEYIQEDENGIEHDLLNTNELNRIRTVNKYIKRIFYGNRSPLLIDTTRASFRKSHLEISDEDLYSIDWLFQVVFDYDEDHCKEIPPNPDVDLGNQHQLVEASSLAGKNWSGRPDPFSTFRSSFEIRTYRRCHRVLMFHHFPELGTEPYLVRSTEFNYADFDYSNLSFSLEDELDHRGSTRIASFIQSATQSGYRRDETKPIHDVNGVNYVIYIKKSMPPLEFEYSKCKIQHEIKDLDRNTLENLPVGIDGRNYQFVDLDGEGVSGILTEQANTWFYKANLGDGKFGPIEVMNTKPSIADLNSGSQQLMDLAGDGQLDLVEISGSISGFYERNQNSNWENFVPFLSIPNVDWNDPHLRLVDLTGDGHADILITENEVFTWYQSLAEKGFEPPSRVIQQLDEEKGPRLVLNEGSQSIYLADMSGDGLSDFVRITNGEICYWPNLGYGRFGSKITMDNCPWFDSTDQFDNRNIRLADIDGSGVTDIIYLGGSESKGIKIYFNQSGNRWSDVYYLDSGLQVDDHSSIQVADLFGNGTACIVWSSPLPGNSQKQLRYLDLMGGIKPHLLVKIVNNLGAETRIEYAPSTKFYLADKAAGKPWITKLPFPVYVVERVITYDYIGRNLFVIKSAYHHGYFDGTEQEFRGFGMVEQWDTEEFATLSNSDNLPIANAENIEETTHVPPVYTKTWYHTGIYIDREHISNFFGGLMDTDDRGEYYREPEWHDDDIEARKHLLDDTIMPDDLTSDEEYWACRALKGSLLRQEVYSKDGTEKEEHPYLVTEQNFSIHLVQPGSKNQNAVFFTHGHEAVNYHYERMLFPVLNGHVIDERTGTVDPANPNIKWIADPRIQHSVTLDVDAYGNVLKSVAIAYGRRLDSPESNLLPEDREKQRLVHIIYTENKFTNPSIDKEDSYRTPLPAETSTFELRKSVQEKTEPSLIIKLYKFDDIWNRVNQSAYNHDIAYEDIDFTQASNSNDYFRRLIERTRTLYRPDNLGTTEDDPLVLLPLGTIASLALSGESYKLAFTSILLTKVLQRNGQPLLSDDPTNSNNVHKILSGEGGDKGGYLQSQLFKSKGIFPDTDPDDYWWVPSGRTFMSPNSNDIAAEELDYASNHFFLPLRYRNPFHTDTVSTESFITLDNYDLFMLESRDSMDNLIRTENDYRVLQPRMVTDPNRNRTEVAFDTLGMVVGIALKGKDNGEGDTLEHFKPDLTRDEINGFCYATDHDMVAAELLKGATTRIIYDLHRFHDTHDAHVEDPTAWQPSYAASLIRETHGGNPVPKIQISFSYTDGFGREIQSKIQAEPGPVVEDGPIVSPRWVGSGWTVFNNKGKPIRHYEPYFSQLADRGHWFEFGIMVGVSSVLFYDPVGRVIATLHPNHTYEKIVFDPWRQITYDVNDTVAPYGMQTGDPRTDPDIYGYMKKYFDALDEPTTWKTWFEEHHDGSFSPEDKTAEKAAAHSDTPTTTYLNSLGRPFLLLTHNRFDRSGVTVNEMYSTRTYLDIEGNQREVRDTVVQNGDSLGRIVMQYDYDMLGNCIHQLSMEAGGRWTLNDITGKPIWSWDSRGHTFRTEYDPLRRPLRSFVTGADSTEPILEYLTERMVYGEKHPEAHLRNIRGRLYLHVDQAGITKNENYDFKGNLLRSSRCLTIEYMRTVDWRMADREDLNDLEAALEPLLENDDGLYISSITYDALNRPIQVVYPHSTKSGTKLNVTQPIYNEANLLERLDAWLELDNEPTSPLDPNTATQHFIKNIDYNAKGQREIIEYGNGVTTSFDFDELTFRLTHMMTLRNGNENMQDFFYFYDPVGNIVFIRDNAQQTIFFDGQVVRPDADYIYDATYRLIKAEGREHKGQPTQPHHTWNDEFRVGRVHPHDGQKMRNYQETYEYDEVGNILSINHRVPDPNNANNWVGAWIREYEYEETSLIDIGKKSNRLSRTIVHPNAPQPIIEQYTYDAHGNTTSMPHLTGMYSDFTNQLKEIDLGGGGHAYYVYDSTGLRIRKVWKKSAGLTDERIYLGDFEVFRRQNGLEVVTLERETLHIMDGQRRIALVETRTKGSGPEPERLIRYQFNNHLGSASLELDEQAHIISHEEYSPYGSTSYQAMRPQIETKRYRYTGKERDEETGFTYHGARYYAPWLGRWTSADPSGIVSDPVLYVYAHDNPIRYFDSDGRDPEIAKLPNQFTDEQIYNIEVDPWSPSYREMERSEAAAITARAERASVIRALEIEVSELSKYGPSRKLRMARDRLDSYKKSGGPVPESLDVVWNRQVAMQGAHPVFNSIAKNAALAVALGPEIGIATAIQSLTEGVTGKSFGALNPYRLTEGDFEIGRDLDNADRAFSAFAGVIGLVSAGYSKYTGRVQNSSSVLLEPETTPTTVHEAPTRGVQVVTASVDEVLLDLRGRATALTQQLNQSQLYTPAMFGSVNDAIFKSLVAEAKALGRLPSTIQTSKASLNNPGSPGIDAWDTATGVGWDLTTAKEASVYTHDQTYLNRPAPDGTVITDVRPLVYTRQ